MVVFSTSVVILRGLVGENNGNVSNSYASGNVNSNGSFNSGSDIGGLVGSENNGNVADSYASGNVNSGGFFNFSNDIGGLIGFKRWYGNGFELAQEV